MFRPNLIERLENLIAVLDQAQESSNIEGDDDTFVTYQRIEDAKGIAGEVLTMIDGR